jgi:hypothetical protein
MSQRRRFAVLTLTGLLAAVLHGGGSARASIITHYEGQYSSGDTGINMGISTNPPGSQYMNGTGQKIFYLSFGSVSSTTDFSQQWIGQAISQLQLDISAFTATNPFGSVTSYPAGEDPTLLRVGSSESEINADFTMADTATITSNTDLHQASITLGVTLRPDTTNPGGDDLNAFNVGGGGTFRIDIDNIDIVPTSDGQVFFPVDPNQQVTVHWSIDAVPEPASAVSLLTGAGLLLGMWMRQRRRVRAA